MSYRCDVCGGITYVGRSADNRYCPDCESLRPIEKIREANQ